MKNFFASTWLVVIFVLFVGFGVLSGCTNIGVSEDEQNLAKSIILSKYPNFESEVQQNIKAKNPTYAGIYGYSFEKTDQENVVIVKYGVRGVDWLEIINPFNNKSTTDIAISVRVDLGSKLVVPVTCVPNDPWWSSQKTICN